ncbi:MAG: hypothetical protein GOVbin1629_63 [Prokaryotic dsDNA virus sp.]|nr:MAG: hypothetical protein GOVbin1629_63 [Prokaryotic dsDNA virus sp.]|tara:strand:+ start:2834 stop:3322 length:489 start_codon:yes stop_codon:yes gene_type:complete
MAYQKLQVGSGLKVIPSALVMIPDPSSKVLSGTTDLSGVKELKLSTASFLSDGIQINAIVYNTTDNTAAYVTAVDSNTTLSLSADIMDTSEDFVIYNRPTNGCILYVGTAGDLTVQMATDKDVPPASDAEVTFKNIANASFLPTQVVRVDSASTAADIIALW